jgi:hypothetical protein
MGACFFSGVVFMGLFPVGYSHFLLLTYTFGTLFLFFPLLFFLPFLSDSLP